MARSALTLLLLLLLAWNAHADPQDSVAVARSEFERGAALARDGRWIDAVKAFARSNELRPHPVTTYNLGFSERALGRLTRARSHFSRALTEHAVKTTGELPQDLERASAAYLREIDEELVQISVTVEPPDARVRVDGRPLEVTNDGRPLLVAGTLDPGPGRAPPSARFELLVDPGTHVIEVSHSRGRDLVVTRSFAKGWRGSMTLSVPTVAPHHPPIPRAPVPRERAAEPADRTLPILVFGVGATALAVGTVTGIAAIRKKSELDRACAERGCPRDGSLESANRIADIATGAFIVSGVAVATGVTLWVTATPGSSDEGATGMAVSGRF